MRLYLTGAGGFIGSHVLRAAWHDGWEVGVPKLPRNRLGLSDFESRLTVVDFGETSETTTGITWRPDAAIHLAWVADPPSYLTSPENLRCLTQSIDLLGVLIRRGCSSVVMTGSVAEYRPADGPLAEESAVDPQTLYAACKVSTSLIGRQLASSSSTQFAWARLFHVYGPLEHPQRLVPSVINTLLDGREFAATDGAQQRDFVHVEDVAAALLRLAAAGVRGEFNVCSGVPTSVRELASLVGDQLGRSALLRFGAIPARPWDPPSLVGSSAKLRALGWAPRFSLDQGLAQTIDWWRRQREAH
jgi:nucleoside-diphosphate-sugar epimerase